MSNEAQRPGRRRFRDVYREERAKVRDEKRRSGNRYADWLAVLAVFGLGLGLLGAAGGAGDKAAPAFVVGAICGVLWLVVKAITSQQAPPRQ